MIHPVLQNGDLLADVAAAPADQLHLWWLGQSGFLVRFGEIHLLLDPYLSDTLTEKYATTDKPHVRMTKRVVDPGRLGFVTLVTSSHAHTDHLDHGTMLPLRGANPGMKLVLPAAIRDLATDRLGDWGEDFRWMDAGETVEIDGVRVTAVPAAHNELTRDDQGRHLYLGYVVQVGPWAIYHSGDTLLYPGIEKLGGIRPIDLAILPINGNRPERRVAGNLDGAEAAQLAKGVDAGLVLPCHYEMFEFNTASPELFRTSCESLGQDYRIPRAGERITLGAG